jgi:hypothetical protein
MYLLSKTSNDNITKQLSLEPMRSKAEGDFYEKRYSPQVQSRHRHLCHLWIDV